MEEFYFEIDKRWIKGNAEIARKLMHLYEFELYKRGINKVLSINENENYQVKFLSIEDLKKGENIFFENIVKKYIDYFKSY